MQNQPSNILRIPIKLTILSIGLTALFLFVAFMGYKLYLLRSDIYKNIYPGEILTDINNRRKTEGLPELSPNDKLSRAATEKAESMARESYFSHNSPDGRTPWQFIEGSGYRFLYAGENLAVDFFDVNELDNAWMNSPGHRANIMNADFTETGIGVAKGVYDGREVLFYVQMFGKPQTREMASAGGGKVLGASTLPLNLEDTNQAAAGNLPLSAKLFSNPSLILKYAYLFLTMLAFSITAAYIMFARRFRQGMKTIGYGLGTIFLIWSLFYVYTALTFVA